MENQNETKAMESIEQSDEHPAQHPDKDPKGIYDLEEIEIEEMAIDGICGVY